MPGAVKLRSGSIAPLIDHPQGVAQRAVAVNFREPSHIGR
jgi:hypothetical protein